MNAWTLECRRAGCGALVAWRCAKKAGLRVHRATGRTALACNAGCGGPLCVRGRKQHTRFHQNQRKMATQLLAGKRTLVAWPRDVDDTQVWQRPWEAEQAAAARAVARADAYDAAHGDAGTATQRD